MEKSYVYFAKGQVPDGYFGDFATVDFYYDPASGKTIVNHKSGHFAYGTPPADSVQEAMYLLKNHPASNARFVTA